MFCLKLFLDIIIGEIPVRAVSGNFCKHLKNIMDKSSGHSGGIFQTQSRPLEKILIRYLGVILKKSAEERINDSL